MLKKVRIYSQVHPETGCSLIQLTTNRRVIELYQNRTQALTDQSVQTGASGVHLHCDTGSDSLLKSR